MYSTQSILKIENSAQEIIPSILPNFTTKWSITTLIGHFVLMISLGLMKSSEVRKAGDRSIYKPIYFATFLSNKN